MTSSGRSPRPRALRLGPPRPGPEFDACPEDASPRLTFLDPGPEVEEVHDLGYVQVYKMAPDQPVSLLRQSEVWQTKDGRVVRIAEMDPVHAANTYRLLMRKASRFNFVQSLLDALSPFAPQGEMASDAFENVLHARAEDPRAWLASEPLLVALRARAGHLLEPLRRRPSLLGSPSDDLLAEPDPVLALLSQNPITNEDPV